MRHHSILLAFSSLSVLLNFGGARAEDRDIWETRAYIVDGTCPSTRETPEPLFEPVFAPVLVGLATALLPKLIDFGLSYASNELNARKAAEEAKKAAKNRTALATMDSFYSVSGEGPWELFSTIAKKCLVVIRGNFSSDLKVDKCEGSTSKPTSGFLHSKFKQSGTCAWLQAQGLRYDPGFYLEMKFVESTDRMQFRLQPHYFVNRVPINELDPYTSADQRENIKKEKVAARYDLETTIEFEQTGSTGKIGIAKFILPYISRETVLDRQGLGKSTGWLSFPPIGTQEQVTARTTLADRMDAANASLAEINRLDSAIKVAQEVLDVLAKELTKELTTPPRPATPKAVFVALVAQVEGELSKPENDGSLFAAILSADPATSQELNPDILAKKKAEIERTRRTLDFQARRSGLAALKSRADGGMTKLVELIALQQQRQASEGKLASWQTLALHGGRAATPLTAKITLTETSHDEVNQFVITAADYLNSNKANIGSVISQQLTALLPKSRDDLIAETAKRSNFILTCISKKQDVADGLIALDKLQQGAPEWEKKKTDILKLKVEANVNCLQGGESSPYADAFGGNL